MLGQLAREDQADRSLDFSGRDGGLLVVLSQTRSFRGDALEHVVDERVHDRHGLGRDSGIRVDLLEHTVDVHRVGLLAGLSSLLVSGTADFLALGGLLGSLGGWLGRHDEVFTGWASGD